MTQGESLNSYWTENDSFTDSNVFRSFRKHFRYLVKILYWALNASSRMQPTNLSTNLCNKRIFDSSSAKHVVVVVFLFCFVSSYLMWWRQNKLKHITFFSMCFVKALFPSSFSKERCSKNETKNQIKWKCGWKRF